MSRYTVTLRSELDRQRAAKIIAAAPLGTRVEVKAVKRSLPQNDLFWGLLTDISRQLPWHGHKRTPDVWKLLFLDALKREVQAVPNLDGDGVVNIGTSSSDLTKGEMSDLIEIIRAFGANHSVRFFDDPVAA